MKSIDVLAINASEAGVMVPALVARVGEGKAKIALAAGPSPPRLVVRGFSSGTHDMSFASFFAAMRTFGPRFTVVTDGRHGAYVGTPEAVHFCPGLTSKVAGTAGAGDAFNSTFCMQLAKGASAGDALQAAIVNAGSVVGYVDTQSGLLPADELARRRLQYAGALPVTTWTLPAAA